MVYARKGAGFRAQEAFWNGVPPVSRLEELHRNCAPTIAVDGKVNVRKPSEPNGAQVLEAPGHMERERGLVQLPLGFGNPPVLN
jgi:hypothetical protein